MKMNKSLTGWIVAAVLAAVLAGVLIYDSTSDEGDRAASLGGVTQGTSPPSDVAADVAQIKANKPESGNNSPPPVPPGQQVRELKSNPQPVCDPNGHPNVFAEWENQPQNLNQAAGQAAQIVVGTAQGVAQGQPYTNDVQGEPGGGVTYPTQNVTIRVDEAVKGPAREGGVVTIERLGDAEGCFRVAGDPPYKAGQQYLLLLEDGRGGRPAHTISSAGRYEIGLDKAVQAMEDNPVAQDIARQKLDQVLTRLKGR